MKSSMCVCLVSVWPICILHMYWSRNVQVTWLYRGGSHILFTFHRTCPRFTRDLWLWPQNIPVWMPKAWRLSSYICTLSAMVFATALYQPPTGLRSQGGLVDLCSNQLKVQTSKSLQASTYVSDSTVRPYIVCMHNAHAYPRDAMHGVVMVTSGFTTAIDTWQHALHILHGWLKFLTSTHVRNVQVMLISTHWSVHNLYPITLLLTTPLYKVSRYLWALTGQLDRDMWELTSEQKHAKHKNHPFISMLTILRASVT